MKKQTNISALKELVNNNVMERVELRTRGAQAFNIADGEEYNVIVAFAKQGGRYYFIDRDGRRFLASHYDRAEWLAGELLEVIANDRAAAVQAADQLERSGSVLVCADLLALFFEECDRRGIKATSTAAGVDNLGRMLTRYDLVKDAEPAQPEDCGKVWQFERGTTDANDYELHEIRRVPSGFMVFFNVCEATGGGCSTMAVYPTYCEALEVLTRCRPGARLVAQPAA